MMTRTLGPVSVIVVLLIPLSASADDWTFNLPGRQFATPEWLVSVSVFHWFTATGGQLTGPWRPLEGRVNWTGEPTFWVRQIKDILDANIDIMYVHLYPGMEQQRINLFKAMSQLRSQGYEVPKAVPFLDPDITWNVNPPFPDVATEAGKDEWVAQYIRFFNQYFSQNTDPQADGFLGIMNGRVMLDTWHMINIVNHTQLTRNDVESRLINAFGAAHPVFNNGIYQVATPVGSYYPSWCDELAYQFCTNNYLMEWTGSPQVRSYTVKGGYWDQNIRNPGYFLARDGGVHYVNAWQSVINDSSPNRRVYIESWNEYDEGSGIYSTDPGPPYIKPPNPNNDVWSNANNPREYIDTTAVYATQFNRLFQRDAKFLDHNVPATLYPGEIVDTQIVVRNQGNAEWSAAQNYKLGVQGPTLYRWTFDHGSDGWALVRNAFGTSGNNAYENGAWDAAYGFSGGGLRTRTGNVDGVAYYNGASTAWSRTFHLDRTMNVSIQFKWRMFFAVSFESNEHGEARLEVDNQLYGLDGKTYLARFSGGAGSDQDTGWRDGSIAVSLSGPGDHTVEIGGWNDRKTSSDEFVDVYVDDVTIIDTDAGSPLGPNRVLLNDTQDEIPVYGGIFRGRPKTFNLRLTTPLTPGSYDLNLQMLQESVAWFGEPLHLVIEVPGAAYDPDPEHGATNVNPGTSLSWSPNADATGHQVYLGTDWGTVNGAGPDSPEFLGTLPADTTTFDPPGPLAQKVDYYWRIDELQSSGPPVKGRVWMFTTYEIPADFDEDLDVDMEDFGRFQACISGSGNFPLAGCEDARLDEDSDVDAADLAIFINCMTGPNIPADPSCAD